MEETAEDLAQLQELIDRSYADAGPHLLGIHTPERRLSAEQVAERLTGMRLLALATVTADGRPIVGPVDGIFFRGRFWFGSAHDSMRFRHLRRRPQVSASHTIGETFAVIVHGTADRWVPVAQARQLVRRARERPCLLRQLPRPAPAGSFVLSGRRRLLVGGVR